MTAPWRKWSLLVMAAALAGCATGPGSASMQKLPTLAQVRSRVPRHYDLPRGLNLPQPRGMVVMQTLDLPLAANTHDLWKVIDQNAIPQTTRQAWHANGLRIGLISANKLRKLQGVMPRVLASDRSQSTGANQPQPLLRGSWLDEPIAMQLPGRDTGLHARQVSNGRVQLLASVQRDPGGDLYLDLTPQLYRPTISIQIQSPLQQQLDGQIFHDLTLRAQMPPGAVMVIGLYEPQHRQHHSQAKTKSNPPKQRHSKQTRHHPAARTQPRIPPSFGRSLLLDPRYDGQAQQLILLGVRPMSHWGGAQSADAAKRQQDAMN